MIIELVNISLIASIILIFTKFLPKINLCDNERIIGFYLIFTNIVILILINSINKFANILDIILLLFLLKLASLMLLTRK